MNKLYFIVLLFFYSSAQVPKQSSWKTGVVPGGEGTSDTVVGSQFNITGDMIPGRERQKTGLVKLRGQEKLTEVSQFSPSGGLPKEVSGSQREEKASALYSQDKLLSSSLKQFLKKVSEDQEREEKQVRKQEINKIVEDVMPKALKFDEQNRAMQAFMNLGLVQAEKEINSLDDDRKAMNTQLNIIRAESKLLKELLAKENPTLAERLAIQELERKIPSNEEIENIYADAKKLGLNVEFISLSDKEVSDLLTEVNEKKERLNEYPKELAKLRNKIRLERLRYKGGLNPKEMEELEKLQNNDPLSNDDLAAIFLRIRELEEVVDERSTYFNKEKANKLKEDVAYYSRVYEVVANEQSARGGIQSNYNSIKSNLVFNKEVFYQVADKIKFNMFISDKVFLEGKSIKLKAPTLIKAQRDNALFIKEIQKATGFNALARITTEFEKVEQEYAKAAQKKAKSPEKVLILQDRLNILKLAVKMLEEKNDAEGSKEIILKGIMQIQERFNQVGNGLVEITNNTPQLQQKIDVLVQDVNEDTKNIAVEAVNQELAKLPAALPRPITQPEQKAPVKIEWTDDLIKQVNALREVEIKERDSIDQPAAQIKQPPKDLPKPPLRPRNPTPRFLPPPSRPARPKRQLPKELEQEITRPVEQQNVEGGSPETQIRSRTPLPEVQGGEDNPRIKEILRRLQQP